MSPCRRRWKWRGAQRAARKRQWLIPAERRVPAHAASSSARGLHTGSEEQTSEIAVLGTPRRHGLSPRAASSAALKPLLCHACSECMSEPGVALPGPSGPRTKVFRSQVRHFPLAFGRTCVPLFLAGDLWQHTIPARQPAYCRGGVRVITRPPVSAADFAFGLWVLGRSPATTPAPTSSFARGRGGACVTSHVPLSPETAAGDKGREAGIRFGAAAQALYHIEPVRQTG